MSGKFKLIDDNLGVSPVIGIILMVAVTVIIAAAIGATAFGIGGSLTDSPPQTTLSTEQKNIVLTDSDGESTEFTAVIITHEGGDDINRENIEVTVDGKPAYATLNPADEFYDGLSYFGLPHVLDPWDSTGSDQISSGDKTIIVTRTEKIEDNDQIFGDDLILYRFSPGDNALLLVNAGPLLIEKGDVELKSGETVRMVWKSSDKTTPLVEHEVK